MENLNAEQIKKALECCIKAECWGDCQELGCPASTKNGCYFYLRTDDDNENVLYIEMLKDALALINSQEQRIKELSEKNEGLRLRNAENAVSAFRDAAVILDLQRRLKNITEENERLRAENEMLLNIKKLNIDKVIADTVRKMQERLDKRFCHDPAFLGVEQRLIMGVIDQTAKEMLEGK